MAREFDEKVDEKVDEPCPKLVVCAAKCNCFSCRICAEESDDEPAGIVINANVQSPALVEHLRQVQAIFARTQEKYAPKRDTALHQQMARVVAAMTAEKGERAVPRREPQARAIRREPPAQYNPQADPLLRLEMARDRAIADRAARANKQ